jgi:hypothetical protein
MGGGQIEEKDIVKLVGTSDVMGIRGTSAAHDVLTDLNPHSEPFEGG